ncbi:MAG: hypothetical protein ACM32E_08680 [Gemmatimonadota bacterium]
MPGRDGRREAACKASDSSTALSTTASRSSPSRPLSTAATNSGLRLVQSYVNGSLPYPAFAKQWQALLTSSAQSWATQNHVDLSKY